MNVYMHTEKANQQVRICILHLEDFTAMLPSSLPHRSTGWADKSVAKYLSKTTGPTVARAQALGPSPR